MAHEGPWEVDECVRIDQWSPTVWEQIKSPSQAKSIQVRDMYVLCEIYPFPFSCKREHGACGRASDRERACPALPVSSQGGLQRDSSLGGLPWASA